MIQETIFQNNTGNINKNTSKKFNKYDFCENHVNLNISPNPCEDSLDNLSPSELKAMIVSINTKYKEKDRQAKEFQQF